MSDAPAYFVVDRKTWNQHPGGRTLIEQWVVEGEAPADFPRFLVEVQVNLHGPDGVQQVKTMAPIEADNVARAFEKLESTARAAMQKIMSQIKQQHVQKALQTGAAMSPRLLGKKNGR